MKVNDAAMLIALEVHSGVLNSHDQEPYTLHLGRVVLNVREAGGNERHEAVAWLHDSIEDVESVTKGYLYNRFIDYEVFDVHDIVEAVVAISKVKGQTLDQYYAQVKANPLARFVKLHGDIKDNFRRNWKIMDEDRRNRMMLKYSKGIDVLSY